MTQSTSNDNENIVDYYKQKTKAKEKEVKNLTKRLRAYTLQEKRILMKEKAFEMEREDILKKVINLENDLVVEKLKGEAKRDIYNNYNRHYNG